MKVKSIFELVPQDQKDEFFEDLIKHDNFKLERIVSNGHKSPPNQWYDQDTNEFVILISGKAELVFEDDEPVILNPGDYLVIPPHKKHRVDWTSKNEQTFWLALHY
jgi:cupin 2 domain-containing protein